MKKKELTKEINLRINLNPNYAKRVHEYGFVELESSWGDEASIINNARVSVTDNRINSVSDITEREEKLLYHLLKNNHGTPFESLYFRFRVIAPIFVIRQWIRHRIASYNEFSQRYRTPMDMFYVPEDTDELIMTKDDQKEYIELLEKVYEYNKKALEKSYKRIQDIGVKFYPNPPYSGKNNQHKEYDEFVKPLRARAREIYRNVIPVAGYTDLYWTINFRSLTNFFNLRICPGHTQQEIMDYAIVMKEMCKLKYPILMNTYEKVKNEI